MATDRLSLLLETQTRGTQEIDKLAAAINKIVDASQKAQKATGDTSGFEKFAKGAGDFVRDPLNAAGDAATGFLTKLGPIGSGAAAAAAGLFVIGKQAFETERALGELGDRIGDTAVRTGLTVREVGEFTFAMKRAGGDISGVEALMRKLSQGLSDTSEEGAKAREGLAQLGIQGRDSYNHLRPMSEIIQELSQKLAAMPDIANRNALAIQIMGKSALDALPDLLELAEGVKRAKELGLAPSDEDVARWNRYQQQIAELDAQWEVLGRRLKEPLVATLSFVVDLPTTVREAMKKLGIDFGKFDVKRPVKAFDYVEPPDPAEVLDRNRAHALAEFGLKAYSQTSAGARVKAEELRANADRLRREFEGMDQTTGSYNIKHAYDVWQVAEKAAGAALDKAKLLSKEEEKRLQLLERIAELDREGGAGAGGAYYRFGDSFIVTGQEIEDANRARRSPSLRTPAEQAAAAAPAQMFPADVPGGPTWRGFVSPQSDRSVSYGLSSQDIARRLEFGFQADQTKAQRLAAHLHAQFEAQARITELRAGPGGEYAAAERVALLREESLKRELQLTGDIARVTEQAQQLQLDRQVRIEEIRRKGADNYRNAVESGFDAAVSGGRGGLSSFVQSQLLGFGRTVAGNVADLTYHSAQGRLRVPGTKNADGELTLFGKLLNGTPFGADPLSGSAVKLDAAGMKLLLAADAQIAAARSMAILPGSGGGSMATAMKGLDLLSYVRSGRNPSPGSDYWNNDPGQVPYVHSDLPDHLDLPNAAAAKKLSFGKYVGMGTAVAGGAFGLASGIHQGGAAGALTAAGSLSGAAGALVAMAGVTGPLAPILMGVGFGLGLVKSMLPDPKKARQQELQNEQTSRAYTESPGAAYDNVDRDYRGGVRPGPRVVVNIQAIDSKSFLDWSQANPGALPAAITHAVGSGNGEDMVATLRQVL